MRSITNNLIDELNEIEFEKYSKSGYVKKIYDYSNNLFSFLIKMFVLYLFYMSVKLYISS
jgi:hypothetical protein